MASKTKSRSLTPVRANSLQPAYRGQTRDWVRNDRLNASAEGQQTAIAILDHELAAMPWHVAKSPSEFYALGSVHKEGAAPTVFVAFFF